jgi:hypothetical protein
MQNIMGFEELFDNNRGQYRNYSEPQYRGDNKNSGDPPQPFGEYGSNFNWQNILEKIRGNNKLKYFVIVAAVLILTIIIGLIIILFPLLIKLVNYINQNGLQSIVEGITGFLDKIWKGSGN